MIDEHLNQIKQIGRFDEMAPPEAFRNRSMDECHKSNLSPVGAAILSALSDSSGLATAHSIRINRILSKEIYYTFTTTDFYILYRCIINLLINAIEATKSQQQREITIYAASNKDNCEVIIKDTGPGFRPEVLQTLSENRSLSTKSNTSGGFGLLNTKQNIEGFGGRLIINSDETGSTIRILLPIAQTPNWFQNVLQFDRIDIVSLDDDIYFQKGLEKHFANCRVFPVGNEDDFLRLLAENSSAFGFVDFDFAGSMDGISFISKNNLQQRTTLVSDCIFADPSCFRRAIENEVRLFPKACFPFGFGPSWGTLRLANNEETT